MIFDIKSVSIRCSYISLQYTMVMRSSSEEDGIVLEKGVVAFDFGFQHLRSSNEKSENNSDWKYNPSAKRPFKDLFWKGSAFIVKRSIYSGFRDDDPGAAT